MDINSYRNENTVPIWEKFTLTINEAASYFNIGERKLRKIIDDYKEYGFVIQNGAKYLIKRQKFEEFINGTSSI